MTCSPDATPGKFIVDSIHGDIHLWEREWQVLDTLPFQRLRRIKQLQMGQVTYPNATYTRFAHSLGALAVMARIVDCLKQDPDRPLEPVEQEDLRLAALLHDVGHYPYSHLMEKLDKVFLTEHLTEAGRGHSKKAYQPAGEVSYPDHEELGKEILLAHGDLCQTLGGTERARKIGDLITRSGAADRQWSKLVHSSLDMDRLDYLKRDSQAAGVPYGLIDINYLLNAIRVSPEGMVGVSEKALHAAEQALLARFFMYKTVYFHKTTFGIEEACRQLLRRMRDQREFDMPRGRQEVLDWVRSERLAGFTDDYVDQLVHRAVRKGDPTMQALARCIESRRPPKLLKEVPILRDRNDGPHHAGSFFWNKARGALGRLSADHAIPIGQFLLCKTPQVRLEPRGPLVPAEEGRTGPSERDDELVKVFIGSEPEPQSLVEVEHSVLYAIGSLFWQSFRLYVVYEGSDRKDVVTRLKAAVQGWDSAQA